MNGVLTVEPPKRFAPGQVLVFGFAGMILVGALLLSLPIASQSGTPTGILDALFTATSAVCVTGLVVVDTADHYSLFGELVILLLIQAGGLGFMTVSTLVALVLGRRIGLHERLVIREGFNQEELTGIVRLVLKVLATTVIAEAAGALLLSTRFIPDFGLARGVYFSIFHAVSAFNNAGFDLMGSFRSLTAYATDPVVTLTVMALVVTGGIGFTVITDVAQKRRFRQLTLHSKVVLVVTAFLLFFGALTIWLLERRNPLTIGGLGPGGQFLASLFQAVTPRTAGFNTIDIAAMYSSTWVFLIILMFIGASPGSTGGGVKTTTVGVLLATVWSTIRGDDDVVVMQRRIPLDIVRRALTIVSLAIMVLLVAAMVLWHTEHLAMIRLMFEATSAFGTVGLTTGITPTLSAGGRLMIIALMFTGRVGPLTLAAAIAARQKPAHFREPEGRIMVG
ncbi:MAG: TrkH family potassium uptake protein [Bacillota bacterium]|nr:TrkH family potassium uptake protein [Bacillota bacterium]